MSINLKTTLLILVETVFLFVVADMQLLAQPKKTLAKQESTSAKPMGTPINSVKRFVEVEFRAEVDRLPPDFEGHNPKAIYDVLDARNKSSEKGEFETTEQFRARVERDNQKPLVGTLTANSILAFASDVNRIGSGITNHYDADNQTMTYALNPNKYICTSTRSVESSCSNFDLIIGSENSYVGVDVLKNRAAMRRTTAHVPLLAVENWHQKHLETIKVELPVDKAIVAKDKSRVLFIGKLTKPFASSSYSNDKPTLHLTLMEIWVFNRETGHIYAKSKLLLRVTNEEVKLTEEVQNLLNEAREHYNERRDEQALEKLREVSIRDSMAAEAYLIRGKIYLRRGELEMAVSNLKTAVFWNNNLIEGYIVLGMIFVERGDFNQAMVYAKSAKQVDPNNADAIALERQIELRSR